MRGADLAGMTHTERGVSQGMTIAKGVARAKGKAEFLTGPHGTYRTCLTVPAVATGATAVTVPWPPHRAA